MSELKQAKEVIRASLVDGDTHYYDLSIDGVDTGTSGSLKNVVREAKEVTKDYYLGTKIENNETKNNVDDGFTIQYSNDDSNVGLVYDGKAKDNYEVTWDSLLKVLFKDLSSLNGYFYAVTENNGPITALKYYSNNNGKAMWTIRDDSLTSGDDVGTDEDSNTISFSLFQKDGSEADTDK